MRWKNKFLFLNEALAKSFFGWEKKYSLKNFGLQRWLAAVFKSVFFVRLPLDFYLCLRLNSLILFYLYEPKESFRFFEVAS